MAPEPFTPGGPREASSARQVPDAWAVPRLAHSTVRHFTGGMATEGTASCR
jgi:hypothetical protein